jgi:tetratricopeptide (TPR) repeat protein
LAARPDDAEAHFLKARVAFGRDRPSEVRRELDRAAALGYPEREIKRHRGFLLVLTRRYVEAEPYLVAAAREMRGPDPELEEALARVFLQTYKLNLAARVLERWTRDAPGDPRPYLWYTEVDRRTQADPAVTIGHYREALKRKPDLDEARLGLAEELRKAHRIAEARQEYDTYLTAHPRDPEPYVGAGRLALDQGVESAAIQHLDRALVLKPDHLAALNYRAAIEMRHGRFDGALEFLNRALRVDPADPELLYNRGLVLSRLGRKAEAQADLRKHHKLERDSDELNRLREHLNQDPNNLEYRFGIARWMFAHGQDDEGVRWSKFILAAHPGHTPTCRLLADYYDRKGDPGLANYYRLQAAGESKPHRDNPEK